MLSYKLQCTNLNMSCCIFLFKAKFQTNYKHKSASTSSGGLFNSDLYGCFLPFSGKSALHWAAAVNNVEATLVLLKNGANRDMQDNKVTFCFY